MPTIFDRLTRFLKGDSPASRLPSSILPDGVTDINAPFWTVDVLASLESEYGAIAKPYQENPLVRAAIEAMRRNAPKATLQVGYFDDDGGFDPVDHPLLRIWQCPAPGESDVTMIEHIYESLIGSIGGTCDTGGDGNAYVQLVTDRDNATGGTVRELQPIPASWIQWPIMGASIGEVVTYPVTGSDFGRSYTFDLPAEMVLHMKIGKSAYGRARGRSPLDAVQAELALIKLVSMYETTVLRRAGVPSFIVSVLGMAGMSMQENQISELKYQIRKASSGERLGDPVVAGGEIKIDTPGFSPQQLTVAEMSQLAVARVCGVLGWAPMSLKQPDTGKTYSNLIEANKASWRDAVVPFTELIAAELTRHVRSHAFGDSGGVFAADPRLSVRFDVSQIEELAVDQDKMADRAVKLFNAGVFTLNEARGVMGLAEVEDGDEMPGESESTTEDTPANEDETMDEEDSDDGRQDS